MGRKIESIPLSAFAVDWGVTLRTVTNWLAAGMPSRLVNGERRVVRSDANTWLREQAEERARSDKPKKASRIADVELEHESVKLDKAKLELARLQGEMITVDEALVILDGKLAPLRSELLTFPQRWAPSLIGCKTMPEMTAKLDGLILAAMRSLSGSDA